MKTFFLFFFFLAILVLFAIAALPSVLSTEWGNAQLVAWVNRSIPGKLELASLSLDWQKGQVAQGIILKDPEGKTVLSIQKVEIDASLWKLIRKSTHLGLSRLEELNATLEVDEKGITNFERALKNELKKKTFFPFQCSLN